MKILSFPKMLLAIGALLLLPFVAMQFTNEVNWSVADFIIMGFLLTAAALLLRLAKSMGLSKKTKTSLILGVLLLFLLVWGELAVGLFGSPWAGN
jgi:Kef-type K+ transport system membrane component KefB